MTEKKLNCKGLACPQPVLETKKALEELPAGAVLTVVVDNAAAKENVTLFAANAGHLVQAAEGNGEYVLTITKGGKEAAPAREAKEPGQSGRGQKERGAGPQGKTVFLVTSNILGQGSPDLGQTLMKSFFTAVA
ncbi:MAG: sulfurtransferase TusA family protein, partial [Desulfotomaculales bacterium]